MVSYFEPLIMAAIGTASKILSSQQQMAVLDQTKTLTESALQMLYTAKEAGGNPKVLFHPVINSCECGVIHCSKRHFFLTDVHMLGVKSIKSKK